MAYISCVVYISWVVYISCDENKWLQILSNEWWSDSKCSWKIMQKKFARNHLINRVALDVWVLYPFNTFWPDSHSFLRLPLGHNPFVIHLYWQTVEDSCRHGKRRGHADIVRGNFEKCGNFWVVEDWLLLFWNKIVKISS